MAIATVGLAPCFVINALSYLTLIVALALMDTDDLEAAPISPRRPGQLREGLRYVWATPSLRTTLLVMAVIGTFTYEFQIVLPVLARSTFDADAGGLSLLLAAMGLGSVVGGLVAAGTITPSSRRVAVAGLTLGLLVGVAAMMPTLVTTAIVLVAVGAASITFITLVNSTLQLTAAPAMRGRVVSLYAVALLGTIPVGGPIMGALAGWAGGRAALLAAGAVAVATVAVAWRALGRADEVLVDGVTVAPVALPVAPVLVESVDDVEPVELDPSRGPRPAPVAVAA